MRDTPRPGHLTSAKTLEHVNVHAAPYGKDRLLVSWESLKTYTSPLTDASQTSTSLRIAHLKP
ncbi:hypothetical protein [Streptomyces pseudovenezuelae]|uniref:hypothetical protein n=1 Tax=Streptomyces pseudovenezuelae TaxID=67350 RepID=UPI002E800AC0|nr:hypothetical protein [Streptomyces pseudovenezuelae]WUA87685.1 hypothetical protein OHO81_10470 [Streptomyces pseudovenezuelae]